MDNSCCHDPRNLLIKAIGWPSCIRTTPMLISKVSVSLMKGLLRLGNVNTRGLVMDSFKSLKALIIFSFKLNIFFLSNCVIGLQMVSYPLTNLL